MRQRKAEALEHVRIIAGLSDSTGGELSPRTRKCGFHGDVSKDAARDAEAGCERRPLSHGYAPEAVWSSIERGAARWIMWRKSTSPNYAGAQNSGSATGRIPVLFQQCIDPFWGFLHTFYLSPKKKFFVDMSVSFI